MKKTENGRRCKMKLRVQHRWSAFSSPVSMHTDGTCHTMFSLPLTAPVYRVLFSYQSGRVMNSLSPHILESFAMSHQILQTFIGRILSSSLNPSALARLRSSSHDFAQGEHFQTHNKPGTKRVFYWHFSELQYAFLPLCRQENNSFV